MKTLATLLLLTAVLGGTWWKITYPEAGIEEARAQAAAATERVRNVFVAARDAALVALAGQGELTSPVAEPRFEALERRLDRLGARLDALDASLEGAGEPFAAPPPPATDDAWSEQTLRALVRDELAALAAEAPSEPATPEPAPNGRTARRADEALADDRSETVADVDGAVVPRSPDEVREQVDALARQDSVTREELREQSAGRNVEYKVYFEAGSAVVTTATARLLDVFIEQEAERTTGVSIFGVTDRTDPATSGRRLALERATAVRSYLLQNGLPVGRIRALSELDEEAAASVLPDGSADAQQHVVVLFAARP